MPIGVATAELCDLDYEHSDGDKSERTDLVFCEDGFELLFDPGQLSGVSCSCPLIAIIFLLLAAS
jgi:hypothetical protein